MGVATNFIIATFVILLLLIYSEEMVGIFLPKGEEDILNMSISIVSIVWPMLIFAAINVALISYFTGMQCAKESALIALARSVIFPIMLILLFWNLFGFMSAFYALPVSELCVFVISIFIFKKRLPKNLIKI